MKPTLRNQRGSALLVTMVIMGMLCLAGYVAIDNANTDVAISYNESHQQSAFYVAEAGAKKAFVAINDDNSWRKGYNSASFGDGTFAVTLADSATKAGLVDTVVIRSRGTVSNSVADVEIWTIPEYLYPYRYGLFADGGITFDKDGCTDSWSSDSGTYALTSKPSEGDIGTNGTINISTGVSIGGDANTAEGGSITITGTGKVLGDTSTTKDSVKLDAIPSTEYDWAKGVSKATTGISGSGYAYNNGTKILSGGANSNIVLQSGVYYFSSITLGQGSKITLASGANVKIYVNSDITLGKNTQVNNLGLPSNFQVFSKLGTLKFNQGNIFYGTFYGPNGHVQFDQTTQVYGSVVSKTIKLDQTACFHYDRSLGRVKHGTTGEMLAVAWREP
jgi:hypothetical protein